MLHGIEIVRVTPEDSSFDKMAETLAESFQNDPAFEYIFAEVEKRPMQMKSLFKLILANDAKSGEILADKRFGGVSCWRNPGQSKLSLWDFARSIPAFGKALGTSALRGLRVSRYIEKNFPSEPYHYLHLLGCRPDMQGKGLGGSLLKQGLRGRSTHFPCYLETFAEDNLALYQRYGFEIIGSCKIPDGPRFWSMAKPPS